MSLVVNHNMMAANTARTLNSHYNRLATSTQRLSSGLRINSAADDAAGLAIRELQRADIAALQQGARNANDAISLIQTADGALGVIDEKLTRLKELAEQAATGTYDSTQRLMIESEYQAMASEITRIANATDFNGMKLLDGTLSAANVNDPAASHDGKGLTSTGPMKIHFGTGNDSAEDYYYITIGDCKAGSLGVGNTAYKRNDDGFFVKKGDENSILLRIKKDLDKPFIDADGNKNYTLMWLPAGEELDDTMQRADINDVTDKQLKFNRDELVTMAGFTVSTQEAAQKSLVAINNAIVSKDKIRAHLGAIQNRLENTITNLNTQAENLQAAESRISDVDVATEMTQFVRNQILTQSAVAMLGQANSLPQMAMQLIGG